ncbi:DDE-type integrase/transposase/recombinase, partial [Candidatus Roizmanbacteria bacterium]|nr:DDE-type integrase/transposase/recombinase [Candidatus Roizmanbacteria bacterium]
MDDSRITSIAQLTEFLKGSQKIPFSLENESIGKKYAFIDETIRKFQYRKLPKSEKKIILWYLQKTTGYKKERVYQLVGRAEKGSLRKALYQRVKPHRIYTTIDIKLLEKTDELHLRLSEDATKEILRREHEVFGKKEYQTISRVSHAHISNLRHAETYRSFWINHTKARQVTIGATRPPENFGRPGSIRIDSVSQKDVYHINSVDEITQWEVVFCVPQISERYMIPALEDIFSQYPFIIFNFHSDRGHETINYRVAELLQRLLIKQTKSRSYHSEDNALVETKNGSVVRKNFGWEHIDQSLTDDINSYLKNFFNPYLNFHRPCGYPTIQTDEKGKKKKVYAIYQTPYEALKQITEARNFLRPGQSFEKLDTIAYSHSDNEFAAIMREEERKLFQKIREKDRQNGSDRKS